MDELDYSLLAITFLIISFGLLMIGSASLNFVDATYIEYQNMTFFQKLAYLDYGLILKQLLGVFLGVIGLVIVLCLDYEDFRKIAKYLYIFNILLLLSVLILGHSALGAQRWIMIGSLQFQPSEIAKIIVIITFADYLAKREDRLNSLKDLIPCFAFVGVPMLLVLLQPDLGTSLVFIAITFGMLFVAGARPAILLSLIGIGLFLGIGIYVTHAQIHNNAEMWENRLVVLQEVIDEERVLGEDDEKEQGILKELEKKELSNNQEDLQAYFKIAEEKSIKADYRHEMFHKFTLKEYQMTRLTTFLSPESDILGSGYHVWQSKISLGSGGSWGKGLLEGTQSHFFLPIRTTDFIFSVTGEEFGLVGISVLLFLYFLLILKAIRIAFTAKDMFGTLLAMGIISKFFFHIMENVGMSMGLMPVAGIPLPLFSYGGTNMVSNLIAIGLLLSVYVRRKKPLF